MKHVLCLAVALLTLTVMGCQSFTRGNQLGLGTMIPSDKHLVDEYEIDYSTIPEISFSSMGPIAGIGKGSGEFKSPEQSCWIYGTDLAYQYKKAKLEGADIISGDTKWTNFIYRLSIGGLYSSSSSALARGEGLYILGGFVLYSFAEKYDLETIMYTASGTIDDVTFGGHFQLGYHVQSRGGISWYIELNLDAVSHESRGVGGLSLISGIQF